MYNQKKLPDKILIFVLFAAVPIFAFVAIVIAPFLLGLYMSFTDIGTVINFEFIGFSNWERAFASSRFWNSFGVTVRFVAAVVILGNVFGFLLALLVTSGIKFQNLFRAGFFTPNLIGGIILGYIWQFLFLRMLPYFGNVVGIPFLQSSWLADPVRAFWALVVVSVWQSSGYMMIIYIAGLASINKSLLEAASLDGAGYFRQLLSIKMPLMIPAFTICLFLTLRNSFMIYDLNLALTNGGPFMSTEMVTLAIFNEAFANRNFGVAQVQALILFVVIATVTLTQVGFFKKREVEE
ncbi:MAG: sugar ABC transporter permease [Defluviitaleaceae bacterium]|nr:sugar ABC transporter permease [Defluviitaleaceae bacterium]